MVCYGVVCCSVFYVYERTNEWNFYNGVKRGCDGMELKCDNHWSWACVCVSKYVFVCKYALARL